MLRRPEEKPAGWNINAQWLGAGSTCGGAHSSCSQVQALQAARRPHPIELLSRLSARIRNQWGGASDYRLLKRNNRTDCDFSRPSKFAPGASPSTCHDSVERAYYPMVWRSLNPVAISGPPIAERSTYSSSGRERGFAPTRIRVLSKEVLFMICGSVLGSVIDSGVDGPGWIEDVDKCGVSERTPQAHSTFRAFVRAPSKLPGHGRSIEAGGTPLTSSALHLVSACGADGSGHGCALPVGPLLHQPICARVTVGSGLAAMRVLGPVLNPFGWLNRYDGHEYRRGPPQIQTIQLPLMIVMGISLRPRRVVTLPISRYDPCGRVSEAFRSRGTSAIPQLRLIAVIDVSGSSMHSPPLVKEAAGAA